jgi:DNA repair protein RadC
MKIKKLPPFKRPREKLVESGETSLTDVELIALLLRSGYKDKNALMLAQNLLPSRRVSDLQKMTFDELASKKGIGVARAASVRAAYEIARRLTECSKLIPIVDTHTAMQHFMFIQKKRKEHFVALYMNSRRELLNMQIISIGSLDSSIVHPREVFAPALKHNAASGNPEPSHADLLLTKRLVQAGQILGITVVDHIIVAEKGVISFREHELI